jgi:hypothetical protein
MNLSVRCGSPGPAVAFSKSSAALGRRRAHVGKWMADEHSELDDAGAVAAFNSSAATVAPSLFVVPRFSAVALDDGARGACPQLGLKRWMHRG